MRIIEDITAMGKLAPKITVCAYEGEEVDRLNGEASEQNTAALGNLFRGDQQTAHFCGYWGFEPRRTCEQ